MKNYFLILAIILSSCSSLKQRINTNELRKLSYLRTEEIQKCFGKKNSFNYETKISLDSKNIKMSYISLISLSGNKELLERCRFKAEQSLKNNLEEVKKKILIKAKLPNDQKALHYGVIGSYPNTKLEKYWRHGGTIYIGAGLIPKRKEKSKLKKLFSF